jgi:hypothetical protein
MRYDETASEKHLFIPSPELPGFRAIDMEEVRE